jgi:hypothetical protein
VSKSSRHPILSLDDGVAFSAASPARVKATVAAHPLPVALSSVEPHGARVGEVVALRLAPVAYGAFHPTGQSIMSVTEYDRASGARLEKILAKSWT